MYFEKTSSVSWYNLCAFYSVQAPSQTTLLSHSTKQWLSTHAVTQKPKYQQAPFQTTLLYHSTKQWLSTHAVTQKPKYQRPRIDAPLWNAFLFNLLTQPYACKDRWSKIRPPAPLSTGTGLSIATTIVLVTCTPPNSMPFFFQRQIQQCRLIVADYFTALQSLRS
jgi:hypothetical protein